MKPLPRILVIVGPTASGKSALALRIAERFHGEIVSADSRLFYRGIDVGTAKPVRDSEPSLRRQGPMYYSEGIPHHLIDVVPPSKTLTLAEYKQKALRAIRGTLKRGRLPIIVGGTGLYVRALVENLEIPEVAPDKQYRKFLARKGKAWILARLQKLDPAYAAKIGPNPRYATRALEVIKATGKPFSAQQGKGPRLFDPLVIGLDPGKDVLKRRIAQRVSSMFRAGLEKEARRLFETYDTDLPSMSGIGYRELYAFFRGALSLSGVKKEIIRNTEQYAKRQMTWWRGMSDVTWCVDGRGAAAIIKKWLLSAK